MYIIIISFFNELVNKKDKIRPWYMERVNISTMLLILSKFYDIMRQKI